MPALEVNDKIECSLHTVRLSDGPVYEALSYAWGSGARDSSISVNGKRFPITDNLKEALVALRFTDRPRALWIDAICINQESDVERTHQVRQMRSIYSSAARVIIWLGPANEDVKKVMKVFAFLERYDYKMPNDQTIRSAMEPVIFNLLNRDWWKRMWTVQELVVATKAPLVGCGDRWVSWKAFDRVIYDFIIARVFTKDAKWLRDMKVTSLGWLIGVRGDYLAFRDRSGRSLEDLLIATSDRRALDPRDKVFALLGLVSDDTTSQLVPDYRLSKNAVYQKTMLDLFNAHGDLEMLVGAMNRQDDNIPTWCIDFSASNWAELPPTSDHFPVNRSKSASGKLRANLLAHDLELGELKVEGCIVGNIATVVPSPNLITLLGIGTSNVHLKKDEEEHPRFQETVDLGVQGLIVDSMLFASHAQSALELRLGREEGINRLVQGETWETITGGKSFLRLTTELLKSQGIDPDQVKDNFALVQSRAFQRMPDLGRYFVEWSHLVEHCPQSWQEPMNNTMASIAISLPPDATFFTTDTGYIGRSDLDIRKDDILCILFGCRLPAVLRKDGETYKLISFTYTSDIMSGELFDGHDNLVTQEFRLR